MSRVDSSGKPSSSSADRERSEPASTSRSPAPYAAGTTLLERYRIVALLGKGGMGEVYRAEDLRLNQTVALKFLPERLAQDGAALARFHREVSVARQVSHPNVCRVFDIYVTDGRHFLTMEYVDGEDLSSLLRRIGRLAQDKALEIARQLCAGVAVAHEYGVVHRDLKPSNIMLDGRGKVRITDFGLAALAVDLKGEEHAGTPAYMAPEQLRLGETTYRSDLYALGLVLYEVFTGRPAYHAETLPELLQLREQSTPANPTTLIKDLDPLIERVILRCLEKDPAQRPASALQVAAALPGGDPLQAALAAGETPSPEMVAAAGTQGAVPPRAAWSLFGVAVAGMAGVVCLTPYSTDLGLAPLDKSPDVLLDRARDLVRRFGYDASGSSPGPSDSDAWLARNADFLRYRASHTPSPQAYKEMRTAEPGPYVYYYRQSPRPMVPTVAPVVQVLDPPYEISGMVFLSLDARGRLLQFRAVPPQRDDSKGPWKEPDWSAVFEAAGFEKARFTAVDPRWVPPTEFDWQAAWDTAAGRPLHVSAASYHGKIVSFQVIEPWTRPWRMQTAPRSQAATAAFTTFILLLLALLVGGSLLARRNIRLGRGDPRGAVRLSLCIFSLKMLSWALINHHVADLLSEWVWFARAMGEALFAATFVWLSYMALEPYVRRRWPDLLISWNRVLSGRLRDPLVGRDILAGALLGAFAAIAYHLTNALPGWVNVPGQTPVSLNEMTLRGPNHFLASLLGQVVSAVLQTLATMFLYLMSHILLRNRWAALIVTGSLLTVVNFGGENFELELPLAVLMAAITLFGLLRFGILSLIVAAFFSRFFILCPLTLDFSRWYIARSLFVLLLGLALLLFGLRTALGSQPLFGKLALDD